MVIFDKGKRGLFPVFTHCGQNPVETLAHCEIAGTFCDEKGIAIRAHESGGCMTGNRKKSNSLGKCPERMSRSQDLMPKAWRPQKPGVLTPPECEIKKTIRLPMGCQRKEAWACCDPSGIGCVASSDSGGDKHPRLPLDDAFDMINMSDDVFGIRCANPLLLSHVLAARTSPVDNFFVIHPPERGVGISLDTSQDKFTIGIKCEFASAPSFVLCVLCGCLCGRCTVRATRFVFLQEECTPNGWGDRR